MADFAVRAATLDDLEAPSVAIGCCSRSQGTCRALRWPRVVDMDPDRREDVHTVVAGVSLPNPASLTLHEKFGFRQVGVFHAVGWKFGKFWDVAWFERPARRQP